jgi:hypothetical protein
LIKLARYGGHQQGYYGPSGKSHNSGGFFGTGKKRDRDIIFVRDAEEKPKQPIPDVIHWQERPLPEGTKLTVSTPPTLTNNGASLVLANDLDKQQSQAFQICQIASNQKLKLEATLPDGSSRKFRIINSVDQLPSDRPVSFNDMVYVGNLRNQLRANGFTLVYS